MRIIKNKLSIDMDNHKANLVLGRLEKNNIFIDSFFDIESNLLSSSNIREEIATYAPENFMINNLTKVNLVLDSNNYDIYSYYLPNVNARQLKKVIREKINLIEDKNEENYSFQYLQSSFKNKNKTMEYINLVSIAYSRIIYLKNIIAGKNLRANSLDLKNNCTYKLFHYADLINGQYRVQDKNILVIDFGSKAIDLTIMKDSQLALINRYEMGLYELYVKKARTELSLDSYEDFLIYINEYSGSIDSDDSEEKNRNIFTFYLKPILELLKISIEYFEEQYLEYIDLIIIQGQLSSLKDLDLYLSKYLNIETIKLNTISNIQSDEEVPLALYSNAIGGLIEI